MATTYKVLGQLNPTTQAVTFQDTGDTVTLNSHGLSNGTPVSFTSITSTTEITANTVYYVIGATTNTFQLASTVGGSALALTTNGSGSMLAMGTLYPVPALTQAVCSTLTICNQGAATSVRVAIRPAGAVIDPKHYCVYDLPLSVNDTLTMTLGITLGATDVVSVYAGTANVSFGLYGSEIA